MRPHIEPSQARNRAKAAGTTVVDLTAPVPSVTIGAPTPSVAQPPAPPTAGPVKSQQPRSGESQLSAVDVNIILDNSGIAPAAYKRDSRLTKGMFAKPAASIAERGSDDSSEAPDSGDGSRDSEHAEDHQLSAPEEASAETPAPAARSSKDKQVRA